MISNPNVQGVAFSPCPPRELVVIKHGETFLDGNLYRKVHPRNGIIKQIGLQSQNGTSIVFLTYRYRDRYPLQER